MDEGKAQYGLIGFFDILGYQSFLENNDVERAARVLEIMNDIEDNVRRDLHRRVSDPDGKRKEILGRIRSLVFSDTILLAMQWDEDLEDLVFFGLAANLLCREMFDLGLPLRGAIKSGRYLIKEFCFAGQVIVDAYKAGKKINLAACTINQALIERLEKGGPWYSEFVNTTGVHYSTPLNDGSRETLYLLHYMTNQLNLRHPGAVDVDIPQLVLNSFWAWDKTIDAGAEIKAKHTENFLRFLAYRFPDDFATEAHDSWSPQD